MDEILVKEGKQPYFVPGLKAGIKKVGVEGELQRIMKWGPVGITDMATVVDKPRSVTEVLDSMKQDERLGLETLTNRSWEDLIFIIMPKRLMI